MRENETITRVWAAEQEILDVFHEVCMQNQLKYSLAYGTLLGAVRHKGFIPWDDDIDIMMLREDYEKLVALWPKVAPSQYILQNYYNESDYTNNFVKIRKDHTTFIQDEGEYTKKYHKGIFIDIFPCDRVASGKVGRAAQYVACAVNLLYSRGYASGTGCIIGLVERCLLRAKKEKRKPRREKAERFMRKWNRKTNNSLMVPCTIACCRTYYPADMFEKLKLYEFNHKKYLTVADADTILKIEYGDYMQLPPEAERVWKHHPIFIDFEHNYEELENK